MPIRRRIVDIWDIGRRSRLCLTTYRPTRFLTACSGLEALILAEGNGSHFLRSKGVTRCRERDGVPLRHRSRVTQSRCIDVVLGLRRKAEDLVRTTTDGVAINQLASRNLVVLIGQMGIGDRRIGQHQYPFVVCTQTTADAYTLRSQIGDARLGERTYHRHKGYIIQIGIGSEFIRRTPSEIASGIRDKRGVLTQIIRVLRTLATPLDRVDHHKRTEILRVGHHTA